MSLKSFKKIIFRSEKIEKTILRCLYKKLFFRAKHLNRRPVYRKYPNKKIFAPNITRAQFLTTHNV